MSRSGYADDTDEGLGLWLGAVRSAIHGKRGQTLLRELRDAMDAMPDKTLIHGELEKDGEYCALGVVGAKRGLDMSHIDPEDPREVSAAFNIANALAQEIVYINDEAGPSYNYVDGKWTRINEMPHERWARVRKWVAENIKP